MIGSVHEKVGSRRGFSLLEILITLSIIVLFTGFFAFRFQSSAGEEALEEASQNLRFMALKAKRRAHSFRQDQFIHFTKSGFFLSEQRLWSEDVYIDTGILMESSVPKGVEMSVDGLGNRIDGESDSLVWTFRESGLNDPVEVLFTHRDGYAKLSFNALTGRAEEESVVR